jgi:two-component system, LytTR family, sensor kinase
MKSKHKIMYSISLVIAVFYCLPWIAVSEQFRIVGNAPEFIPIGQRMSFLFCTVFIITLVLFQFNLFWKRKGSQTTFFWNATANIFIVVLSSLVWVWFAQIVFGIGAVRAYFVFYLFRNITILLLVLLITYGIELVETLRQEKIETLTLQRQAAETQLAVLRSQVDPHFLFNTLTTLSSLVKSNSKETLSFVDSMADTFRYMLEKRELKFVSLHEELRFLESYLFMMKRRFDTGFEVEVKIGESCINKNIPQFALQIAVENALKHNIVSAKHPLKIEIYSHGSAIHIRNNVQRKKTEASYGIGLENLSNRYRLIKKQMTIKSDDNFFELNLPLL